MEDRVSTLQLLVSSQPDIMEIKDEKFSTVSFLPISGHRKAEGGLRTRGFFKKNYIQKPLITIVTAVYNGGKFLEETIRSVTSQSYDNVEYIVIDGGSTDDTIDILKKYDYAIDYWVSESDRGMYDAINKGLCLGFGEISNFINSDDVFSGDKVLEEVAEAFNDPLVDVTYGDSIYFDSNSGSRFRKKTLPLKQRYFATLGMPFSQPTFFWRSRLAKESGQLDLRYQVASDYEFIARLCLKSKKIVKLKPVVACFRLHGNSFGDAFSNEAYEEFKDIRSEFEKGVFKFYFVWDRVIQKAWQVIG